MLAGWSRQSPGFGREDADGRPVGARSFWPRERRSSREGRVAAVGGDSGRAPGPTRGSPQLRFSAWARVARPLAASRGCLGWRLAADLELVRTRGIRLFN